MIVLVFLVSLHLQTIFEHSLHVLFLSFLAYLHPSFLKCFVHASQFSNVLVKTVPSILYMTENDLIVPFLSDSNKKCPDIV